MSSKDKSLKDKLRLPPLIKDLPRSGLSMKDKPLILIEKMTRVSFLLRFDLQTIAIIILAHGYRHTSLYRPISYIGHGLLLHC